MLLHGRLALRHALCKRHATFVISSSCKFNNCFSHAAAFIRDAARRSHLMSARMISDQAAIAVGAFSVVDTEAGRVVSFAVSLDGW